MRYLLLVLMSIGINCLAFPGDQTNKENAPQYIQYCTPSWTCDPEQASKYQEQGSLTIYYPPRQRLYIVKTHWEIMEMWRYLEKGEVKSFTIEDHKTFNLNTGRLE